MCARFQLAADSQALIDAFGLPFEPGISPRQEIFPTDPVLVVASMHKQLVATHMRWGYTPSWSKVDLGAKLINARSETLAERNTFRHSFARRRCLLPASAYFEWRLETRVVPMGSQQDLFGEVPTKVAKVKQKYRFERADTRLFMFAGVWDTWIAADGTELDTVAILTCNPNYIAAKYHHRMPVMLDPEHHELWLDERVNSDERLQSLLRPVDAGLIKVFAA